MSWETMETARGLTGNGMDELTTKQGQRLALSTDFASAQLATSWPSAYAFITPVLHAAGFCSEQ